MGDKKVANQHRITPSSVIDVVHEFMPVALDPCWNEYALTDAEFVCDGVEVDGLTVPWSPAIVEAQTAAKGRNHCVFVNPPWSDPLPWVEKVVAEHLACSGHSILLWLPLYPETKASAQIWDHASRLCFWGKRINHMAPPIDSQGALLSGGTPELESGSKLPTWLSYFGPCVSHFEKVFAPHGRVVSQWSGQHPRWR